MLGKACQHQGESLLEQEPKNYARELEWSLPQYTILPPTGRAKCLARYRQRGGSIVGSTYSYDVSKGGYARPQYVKDAVGQFEIRQETPGM